MSDTTIGAKIGWTALITVGSLIILAIFFRLMCTTFVDNYEFAYQYDAMSGEMKSVNRQGYVFTKPWVSVNTIDTRPIQVCINANARILNCKLVQFDTTGWKLFVSWHGRKDYSNGGYLNDILMSYAYDGSGKSYPFLKIVKELKQDDPTQMIKKDTTIIKNDTVSVK